MALDYNSTKCLLYSKAKGVDFTRTATIGRQSFHNMTKRVMRKNLTRFNYFLDDMDVASLLGSNGGYADGFLKMLGAEDIHSFDYSAYEGATHLHDFNQPIPDGFKGRYSAVIDCGSLEHIFNFPVAVKNCMEMVREGGHFIGVVPANNFMGHGFYQFSPELFFRIFNEPNGFEIEDLIVFLDKPNSKWYSVTDPEKIRQRVMLLTSIQTFLFFVAKKTATKPIFEAASFQSDYTLLWKSDEGGDNTWLHKIIDNMPLSIKLLLRTAAGRYRTINRKMFKVVR